MRKIKDRPDRIAELIVCQIHREFNRFDLHSFISNVVRENERFNQEELFECMQCYMEYVKENDYITPMEWYKHKKHF